MLDNETDEEKCKRMLANNPQFARKDRDIEAECNSKWYPNSWMWMLVNPDELLALVAANSRKLLW